MTTTWSIEINEKRGHEFPWKAAVVAAGGKRQEVGEFLDEKEARTYAHMEFSRLTAREKQSARQPSAA